MSAILSADDLNDFISPGVACIKPVETLPLQHPKDNINAYEVTTEDNLSTEPAPPASITLTDCLACSGCVTSAEAILVSLQSHAEVLNALDSSPSIPAYLLQKTFPDGETPVTNGSSVAPDEGKVFVASVSPQVRASLAATYGTTEREAGWMIEQLLSGPQGVGVGGVYGNSFTWVVDTNPMREVNLVMGAEEVRESASATTDHASPLNGFGNSAVQRPKKPILTSACPGWICYAEKTHPHVLPHLSRLKSPQALSGSLLKTVLSKTLKISPRQIWHLAIMPCFDKKLEASRQELTDVYWKPSASSSGKFEPPVRDVDCVITARELLMLADIRGISFPGLPRKPLELSTLDHFPDPTLAAFLHPPGGSSGHLVAHRAHRQKQDPAAGSSGGYLYHILRAEQLRNPGSIIRAERGRNADVIDYALMQGDEELFHAARYYGFRNIQNLVRKLKPIKKSRLTGSKLIGSRKPSSGSIPDAKLDYVEVMACPGGCTNGGGQIKIEDLGTLQGVARGISNPKEWLATVDEAYFSMDDEAAEYADTMDGDGDVPMNQNEADLIEGISTSQVRHILAHWSKLTDIPLEKLLYTSFRQVESDVGKAKGRETERVAELAGKIGGGW